MIKVIYVKVLKNINWFKDDVRENNAPTKNKRN